MLADSESSEDFSELLESWFAIFQPANPVEEALVAQAARAEYCLARLTFIEDYMRAQDLIIAPAVDDSLGALIHQQVQLFRNADQAPFYALSRQTGHYRRQRSSALRALRIVQSSPSAKEKSGERTQEVVENTKDEVFQAAAGTQD